MLRFKMVLLSMFAVFAIGAMASASASADSCNGGSHWIFCILSTNLPIHNLAASGESGLSLLEGKVGITTVLLHCKDDKFAGTLKLLGLAEGEIDFLNCTVEQPATCSVSSLILADVHIQVLSATTGLATGNKAGGAANEFTSVTLSNCSIAGTYTITGTQEIEFPKGGEGLVEHEIVAKKGGSKLKLGSEPASFRSTAKVHLDSNEAWLIMAGE